MSKIFQMGGFNNTSSQITVSGTNLDVLTYNNNGSLLLFQNATNVDILVVGGGGSGRHTHGSGGGAGAVIYLTNQTLNAGTYTISIGAGGICPNTIGIAQKGQNTTISYNGTNIYSALGGGGGGGGSGIQDGGSGGGESGTALATNIPSGLYGNNGGSISHGPSTYNGGGGGGAGGSGGVASQDSGAGAGGAGRAISITGSSVFYGGGGGGGSTANNFGAVGGSGGGASGGSPNQTVQNGVANTGGGGGGGYTIGGTGGSGIVIIRFNNSTSLTIPSLQSSGAISFSDLKRIFEDTNSSIVFSRYYNNHSSAIAYGCGSPNTGNSISLSQMYNKNKEYLKPGVSPLTFTDKTGTTQINYRNYFVYPTANSGTVEADFTSTSSDLNGGFAIIPTDGLVFNWYGTNYGNSSSTSSDSRIYWSADNILGFGTWYKYTLAEYVGFLIGAYLNRYGAEIYASPSVVINKNHSYVRIIISSVYDINVAQESYYDGGPNTDMIKLNIRLIRGPKYQYIELKVNEIRTAIRTGAFKGRTSFRTTTSEINIFNSFDWPTPQNNSIVLRSDLQGNSWEVYTANHYVDV